MLCSVRADLKQLTKDFDKTEDDLKAVQNAGQIIAEVLKQLDDDRCTKKKTAQTRGDCCREHALGRAGTLGTLLTLFPRLPPS